MGMFFLCHVRSSICLLASICYTAKLVAIVAYISPLSRACSQNCCLLSHTSSGYSLCPKLSKVRHHPTRDRPYAPRTTGILDKPIPNVSLALPVFPVRTPIKALARAFCFFLLLPPQDIGASLWPCRAWHVLSSQETQVIRYVLSMVSASPCHHSAISIN